MSESKQVDAVQEAIAALSRSADPALAKAALEGLPDRGDVIDWVERTKQLVLMQRDRSTLRSEIPYLVDRLRDLMAGLQLPDGVEGESVIEHFLRRLPEIRTRLSEDVEAAYEGDPAAKSFAEIVLSYPSIRALAIYRVANALHVLGVPVLPRMMTEYAHDRTGIDIHPGATIGRRLFIDHGTGVVVGETTLIGDNVRLYQGVTLGAKAPRHSEPLRGKKRHPTIEDDVTIYAGATILGGETTIGAGTVIGGNVWLIASVPPYSKVIAEPPTQLVEQRRSADDERQLRWDI